MDSDFLIKDEGKKKKQQQKHAYKQTNKNLKHLIYKITPDSQENKILTVLDSTWSRSEK